MLVLVIAPHPDDETLGVGGSIYRHIMEGAKVFVVFATIGEKCYYVHGVEDISFDSMASLRMHEAFSAMRTLGVPKENLIFLKLPDAGVSERIDELSKKLRNILLKLKLDESVTLPGLIP